MTTDNLAEAVDALGRAFEEFKHANDNRLAQIERKGVADAVTVETVEKLNDEISRLADHVDRVETAFKRTPRGAVNDNESIGERKAAKEFFGTIRDEPLAAKDNEPNVEEYLAYRSALSAYIRSGKPTFDESKALSVGVEADGGYWVTPEISNRVVTRLFETSPMRSIAEVITIGTDAYEFPIDSNDATSGGWVGEKGTRGETATPEIGEGRIPIHEQFANPRATQKLLDDARINVEQWLGNKIADKLTRTENITFVTGNGEAKPRGFLDYGSAATTDADSARSWGVLQYTASGNASGFTADPDGGDALIDLIYSLSPAYRANARFITNRATLATVRKMKDSDGQYFWAPGLQAGQPSMILGFPITEAEDLPNVAANAFPMAFGDFREGYTIVERQGIRVLRDPFSAKPFVQFYTTKRVGGDVVNFDAIKLFKISTS